MQKGFDKEPAYDRKYVNTKIKCYKGKINTNFIMIECLKLRQNA